MITPRFYCTQTSQNLTIELYCPSVRASSLELHTDQNTVTIHLQPYFLRLHLPGAVRDWDDVDDAHAGSAVYDPSSGTMKIILVKAIAGQDFPELDLLAKLLAPPPKEQSGPSIEVLDSQEDDALVEQLASLDLDDEKRAILEAAENDWTVPQSLPPLHTISTKPYGFLDLHSGYFTSQTTSLNEVSALGPEAEALVPAERRRRRLAAEDEKFDSEHYMADLADDEYIQELLAWSPSKSCSATMGYTEAEQATMLHLPRREYLFNTAQTHSMKLALISILFGWAYDVRTTLGDPGSESAWTVAVLVPAFAGLDPPPYDLHLQDDLACTLLASYHRALAYPLFRSWALCEAIRVDVSSFLKRGKQAVVRALLELKTLLDAHEVYYVYSKVWVDDMLVWTMAHLSEESIVDLGNALLITRVKKSQMRWDIEELDQVVGAVMREVGQEDDSDDDEGSTESTDEDSAEEQRVERQLTDT